MVTSGGEDLAHRRGTRPVPEAPHRSHGHADSTEDGRNVVYIGGQAVPLTVLPAARVYPRQAHWTWTDVNVLGEETPYLAYSPPLPRGDTCSSQLPVQYDLSVIRPLDGPAIEAGEQRALRMMQRAAIPVALCDKVLRQVSQIKARGGTRQLDEQQLFKRALYQAATGQLQPRQRRSIRRVTRIAGKLGDSIQRLVSLYAFMQNRRVNGQREMRGHVCTCTTNVYSSHCASIGGYFWTEDDLASLATGISVVGLDYCSLANFLSPKSCHQIRKLLDRHGICSAANVPWMDDLRRNNPAPGSVAVPAMPAPPPDRVCCPCTNGCRSESCSCRSRFHECLSTHTHRRCQNMRMGMGCEGQAGHRVCIRPSPVAGWGCFARVPLPAAAFLMEYTGEIISQEEAERRGFWCDLQKSNYFYELDDNFIVDATYAGTAMRFCNHSARRANVQAEIWRVNGRLRVGIFTKREIAPEEELFLDYGEFYVQKMLQHDAAQEARRQEVPHGRHCNGVWEGCP